jgi:hypothetical protein
MSIRSLLPLLLVAAQAPALAQPSRAAQSTERPLPVSNARRATTTIRLDGKLDETAWHAVPLTNQFTQVDPDEGKPASQRTDVRVLFDDEYLYVGARLHDDGQIIGRLGRRDMSA